MKKLLLCCLLLIPLLSFSQETPKMKERRVYYLDCTGSMVKPNKLFDPVRDNLKAAINAVNDETTELMVIPFYDKNTKLTPCCGQYQHATEEGKAALCNAIDNLKADGQHTVLNILLEDFHNNRVSPDPNCITYMFLMTDGDDEAGPEKEVYGDPDIFKKNIAKWGQRYGDRQVYGFYVILQKDQKKPDIEQPHLWYVETADVNINLLRLGTNGVFNVRNDKYMDIPIWGDPKGADFRAQFTDQTSYNVEKTKVVGDKLRVWIVPAAGNDTVTLPKEVRANMKVDMSGAKPFTFLVTDRIGVVCKNEKEYSLKVSVK